MVTRRTSRPQWRLYIAEWMAERNLTDEQVADKLNVDRVTVTRWRTQQHRLNTPKIAQLAWALDVMPADLWRPPTRPSVDALLREAPDEIVQRAADMTAILLRSS